MYHRLFRRLPMVQDMETVTHPDLKSRDPRTRPQFRRWGWVCSHRSPVCPTLLYRRGVLVYLPPTVILPCSRDLFHHHPYTRVYVGDLLTSQGSSIWITISTLNLSLDWGSVERDDVVTIFRQHSMVSRPVTYSTSVLVGGSHTEGPTGWRTALPPSSQRTDY